MKLCSHIGPILDNKLLFFNDFLLKSCIVLHGLKVPGWPRFAHFIVNFDHFPRGAPPPHFEALPCCVRVTL